MSLSKIQIANVALQKIGARVITAFDENSSSARAVNSVYDVVRDEILGESPWSFAQKRAALVQVSVTPAFTDDNMTYVYAKPSDLIKINFINIPQATVKVEGPYILSDTSGLGIIYTFRNDDPATYFPLFSMALAVRLAAELCFNLSESTAKAEAVFEQYEKISLPRAQSADSQQSTPTQPIQDEWESAKDMAGATFIVQPGAQTWQPYP